MPSLSSFINSSQFSTESTTATLLAGMITGSTYNTGFTLSGPCGSAGNDPGGLFGWLVYSRANYFNPAKGTTADKYIVYTSPQQLVGDLNALTGVTSCLLANTSAGSTYSLFLNSGTINNVSRVTPLTNGKDFLFAVNYLAYGGELVLSGSAAGLDQYIADTGNYFDIVIGQEANSTLCQWLIDQPYTAGIFPSIADSTGATGAGYTAANYGSLFGSSSLVTGTTVANRVFNVCGIKAVTDLDTSTLLSNSKITYEIPAVSDVGGAFTRAKNRNETYLTVAGTPRSNVLNGNIVNSIDWTDTLKTTLRTNRVNFYVNNNPKFLGADLTGATSSATYTANDRIGPSRMRSAMSNIITDIGLKYLFAINNTATRNLVESEISTALDPFTPYIDPTQTQIICDSSNNDDNSSTLNITVIVKPILSIDSFVININLTQ